MKRNKERAEVIDLGKRKQSRLVLECFDKLEREAQRELIERKAEVERKARKQY